LSWGFELTFVCVCVQTVEADGKVCEAAPSETLPLSQAYYIF